MRPVIKLRAHAVKSITLAGAVVIAVALGATSPRAADLVIKLVDVAAQSGLTLLNICGGPDKDFIVDEVGSGAHGSISTATATSTPSSSTDRRAIA